MTQNQTFIAASSTCLANPTLPQTGAVVGPDPLRRLVTARQMVPPDCNILYALDERTGEGVSLELAYSHVGAFMARHQNPYDSEDKAPVETPVGNFVMIIGLSERTMNSIREAEGLPLQNEETSSAMLSKLLEHVRMQGGRIIWSVASMKDLAGSIGAGIEFAVPTDNDTGYTQLLEHHFAGYGIPREIAQRTLREGLPPGIVISQYWNMPDADLETVLTVAKSTAIALMGRQRGTEAYDPAFINTDEDVSELAEKLEGSGEGIVAVFSGPSGSGKTQTAIHLATQHGWKPIVVKPSDLFNKWLGDTEKQIAKIFQGARSRREIPIFDEADSYITDRKSGQETWHKNTVNEFLIQMEEHTGPVFFTTNFKDALDSAAMSRSVYKIEFKPMTRTQAAMAFQHFLEMAAPADTDGDMFTARDFTNVKKKKKANHQPKDLLALLRKEAESRGHVTKNPIGF